MDPTKIWAIARREFVSYFASPVVYGFLLVFLLISGFITINMIVNGQAQFSLSLMMFVLLFLVPLITMRLISRERSTGTIELIFTSPVHSLDFVLGKFLSVFGVYVVAVLFTLEFPLFLYAVGDPDLLVLLSQYIGMLLAGGSFLAIGLLASCLTDNQLISALICFFVLLTLWLVPMLRNLVPESLDSVAGAIDLSVRLQNFDQGLLTLEDVIFFISLTAGPLYGAVVFLNTRSWRK